MTDQSAVPRGRPLKGAPGWRVIEHPRRRSWRAGYVIVPVALVVGLIQAAVFWNLDWIRWGWAEDLRRELSESAAPSTADPPAAAPNAVAPSGPAGGGPAAVSRPPFEGRTAQGPPLEGSPPPDSTASALNGTASADETSSVEPPSGSGAAPIRVSIYHTAGSGHALAAIQLAAVLETHGFAIGDIRAVRFDIQRSSVRYFFERDRPASQRLVEAADAFFDQRFARAPEKATDFITLAPMPVPGTVEIWLSGQPSDERRPS